VPAAHRRRFTSSVVAVAADADVETANLLPDALQWPSRDQTCGTLREGDEGKTVTLCGWVDKQRDMGGIVFADVRDHTGLCQIVSDDRSPQEAVEALAAIRAEWVVCARGRVRRPRRAQPQDADGRDRGRRRFGRGAQRRAALAPSSASRSRAAATRILITRTKSGRRFG
jgi:aspartyl-tRNA synthetase